MTGNVREHNVVGLDMSVPDAIDLARRVLIAQGFQNIAAGPTAATFVRDYREPKMTVLAYGLAVPTLGLSLFALTSRAQEYVTVSGHESARGTRLALTGTSSFETMTEVEAGVRAGSGPQLPNDPDSGYSPFPLLGLGRPDAAPPVAASPSRRSPAPEEDGQPSWRNAPQEDEQPSWRNAPQEDEQPSWRNAPQEDEQPSWRNAPQEDEQPSWRNAEPDSNPFPGRPSEPDPFPSAAPAAGRRPSAPEPDPFPSAAPAAGRRPSAPEPDPFPSAAPAAGRRPSAPEPDPFPGAAPAAPRRPAAPEPVSGPAWRPVSADPEVFPNPAAASRRSPAPEPAAGPAWRPVASASEALAAPAAPARRAPTPDPFPNPAVSPRRAGAAPEPFSNPTSAPTRRSAAQNPAADPSPFPAPAPLKAAASFNESPGWPEPEPDPEAFPEAPPPFSGPPPALAPSPFPPSGPVPTAPKRSSPPVRLPSEPPTAPPSGPSGPARSRRSMPMAVPDPGANETMLWPAPSAFAAPPEGVPEPAEARWLLTIDDGRTIEVQDFGLIGRDPELADGDPDGELVPMVDPEMSVSKTHAAFGVDDDGLWFLDRHSTNGSAMVGPDGDRVALEPGVPTTIAPGSEVWIGRRHLKVDLESDG